MNIDETNAFNLRLKMNAFFIPVWKNPTMDEAYSHVLSNYQPTTLCARPELTTGVRAHPTITEHMPMDEAEAAARERIASGALQMNGTAEAIPVLKVRPAKRVPLCDVDRMVFEGVSFADSNDEVAMRKMILERMNTESCSDPDFPDTWTDEHLESFRIVRRLDSSLAREERKEWAMYDVEDPSTQTREEDDEFAISFETPDGELETRYFILSDIEDAMLPDWEEGYATWEEAEENLPTKLGRTNPAEYGLSHKVACTYDVVSMTRRSNGSALSQKTVSPVTLETLLVSASFSRVERPRHLHPRTKGWLVYGLADYESFECDFSATYTLADGAEVEIKWTS